MSEPYVGEIRMFGGNFAPVGWNFCDGSLLSISEYDTLFMLIGTTYGGDGESTFAVPDLRGRVPVHMGTLQLNGTSTPFTIGDKQGVEDVNLSLQQTPAHAHGFLASGAAGNSKSPGNGVLAVPNTTPGALGLYGEDQPVVPYPAQNVSVAGGSQPHTNLQPFLCISFIISLFGIFPQQT